MLLPRVNRLRLPNVRGNNLLGIFVERPADACSAGEPGRDGICGGRRHRGDLVAVCGSVGTVDDCPAEAQADPADCVSLAGGRRARLAA